MEEKEIHLCECGCLQPTKPGRRFINGHNHWNTGLTKETDPRVAKQAVAISVGKTGVLLSTEHCKAISVAMTGDKNPFYGKHHSEKSKKQIKDKMNTPEYIVAHFKENHWAYINGPRDYHINFTESFRQEIRNRDVICQICGKINEQNINETTKCLEVHHIYYDPETNDCSNKEDFITLCSSCHMKTNYNRDYWTNYFIMQKLLVT